MKLLAATFLFACAVVAFASDQLGDALNHQYKDHIYTLRQPMTLPTQQYDSQGNSPTASALGPWTIYGRMQIKNIKLEKTRVIVEGQRIGMEFDRAAKILVPVPLKDKIKLEISLAQPLDSADQAHTVLSYVFAFSKDDFLASVPALWRQYLTDNLESYADDGSQLLFKPFRPVNPPARKTEEPVNGVYHVGNGVTFPKRTFTPEPDYSPTARAEKFRATLVLRVVVDDSGAVRNVGLAMPAGLGLDEEAERTVATWKFEPALRNGQPVAVEISVEMSFNLY